MWCSAHAEGKVLLQRTRGLLAAFTYADTEEETQIKSREAHLQIKGHI